MTLPDLKTAVYDFIGRNKTEQALKLLEKNNYSDSEYLRKITLLRSRYSRVTEKVKLGLVIPTEETAEIDWIVEAILEFTDELQEEDLLNKDEVVVPEAQPISEAKPARISAASLPDMVSIPGGTFEMGDVMGDNENEGEKPIHTITLSGFHLGRYPVTFAEYDAFCEAVDRKKPEDQGWGRDLSPIINVSWYDAVEYCNWLSQQHGYESIYDVQGAIVIPDWTANGYRLPTEAEWEYAARERGRKLRFGNGKDISNSKEINFNAQREYKKNYSTVGEYRGKTVPVGTLNAPNALGLHDMSGNVFEWCWDCKGKYPKEISINPHGFEKSTERILRGGGWSAFPNYCRVTSRSYYESSSRLNNTGFRLARNA